MMTIKVQYQNSVYDIVLADTLQRLLDNGKIKKFYRYSEKRWITIGVDPVRNPIGKGANVLAPYSGPDRRAPQIFDGPSLAGHNRMPIWRN
jgi:hypothetical protein